MEKERHNAMKGIAYPRPLKPLKKPKPGWAPGNKIS